jgi:hypothetical protein
MVLNETEAGKSIIFSTDPATAKAFIPKILQFFQGNFINLTSPTFWKILKNPKTQSITYEISQNDLKKMAKYFGMPYLPSEQIRRTAEDTSIYNKIQKFKTALGDNLQNSEQQKWLNDFFATILPLQKSLNKPV